jgi:hypothetical protein
MTYEQDPLYATADQGREAARLDFCGNWIDNCDNEQFIRAELVESVGASIEFQDAYIAELKLLIERSVAQMFKLHKEFEIRMQALGINDGAMTFRYHEGKEGRVFLNEHVNWMWLQFLRLKGV